MSVVIPTYNGVKFLSETLSSVLAQSQSKVEIIVIDDGSNDGTLELAASVAPDARCEAQANAGVGAARNRGLALAHGRYVAFLDQDDIWHPEQLVRQVAWLDDHEEFGAAVCPYHHWRPIYGRYPDPMSLWGDPRDLDVDPAFTGFVYHQFLLDCWALTSGTLLRRSEVEAVGGFDTSLPYSEDWDLWLRLSRATQFAQLRWPNVLYRHHSSQGSRRIRATDYRTTLLLRAADRYGLASADGRAIDAGTFGDTVARYRADFGYQHLAHGSRLHGVRALSEAWLRRPSNWRWMARAIAGSFGWRPR